MYEVQYIALHVPAAVGTCAPQHVPKGGTAGHVQGGQGEVSLFVVPAHALPASLGICPLETAPRSLATGDTKALQELQCGKEPKFKQAVIATDSMHLVHPRTCLQKQILFEMKCSYHEGIRNVLWELSPKKNEVTLEV